MVCVTIAQQSYCRHVSVCLMVIRPLNPFPEKPRSELTPNFWESYLFTIYLDHICIFVCWYLFILFFMIFFSLSLTWDHMRQGISSDISSESTQHIHSPKFMHSPRERRCQSSAKNYEISNLGSPSHPLFFFVSLTWYHMAVNVSNDISAESTHQIHSSKLM